MPGPRSGHPSTGRSEGVPAKGQSRQRLASARVRAMGARNKSGRDGWGEGVGWVRSADKPPAELYLSPAPQSRGSLWLSRRTGEGSRIQPELRRRGVIERDNTLRLRRASCTAERLGRRGRGKTTRLSGSAWMRPARPWDGRDRVGKWPAITPTKPKGPGSRQAPRRRNGSRGASQLRRNPQRSTPRSRTGPGCSAPSPHRFAAVERAGAPAMIRSIAAVP